MIDTSSVNRNKKRKITRQINFKKIICVLLIMIIVLFIRQSIFADTIERTTIVFRDQKLFNKLRDNVFNAYDSDYVLYNTSTLTIEFPTEEIPNVKSINISGADIEDISGIEVFEYLEELYASQNKITDISNLKLLTHLIVLDLGSNNQFSDIGTISEMESLVDINLNNTGINTIEPLTDLPNLRKLNIGSTSIADIKPLKNIPLTDLNLSGNSNINNIFDITPIGTLRRLDISNCVNILTLGSAREGGIYNLTNLVYLNIDNNKALSTTDLGLIGALYEETDPVTGEKTKHPYLANLEELRANKTKGISFNKLAGLSSLKILYMSECTSTISLLGIHELESLEELYLKSDNISDIEDINYFEKDTDTGEMHLVGQLHATRVVLSDNKITDLTPFVYFPSNQFKYLNLDSNQIADISPIEHFRFDGNPDGKLILTNQQLSMSVRKKSATLGDSQFIILYPIFQDALNSSSLIYNSNTRFVCNNCQINETPEYMVSPNFNVEITNEVMQSTKPEITVKINGGIANGTTMTLTISTSTSAIDSLVFMDPNLARGILNNLKITDKNYCEQALNIINLQTSVITSLKKLDLRNYGIQNLRGLGNFTNLEDLNLANNRFTDINELRALTKLKILNISNNSIGDNNSALEDLTALTSLSMGNTGITNLHFLEVLNVKKNNKMAITLLDIQSNSIEDITEVGKLAKLNYLNVSKNKISDLTTIENCKLLATLNISSNKIEDISTLANFTAVSTLFCDDNIITDISPLATCPLTYLSIKGNQIEDLSPLRYSSLFTLYCDNNHIGDVSPIENLPFTVISDENPFTAYNQLIALALDEDATGNISIPLPNIFISAKDTNSKVYTSNNLVASNCSISADNRSVELNIEELGDKIATVTIKGGNANETKLSIAPALRGYIAYSNENLTNQDVVATVSFNRTNVTVLNNDGSTEYTFTKNGEFVFEFEDENGFTGRATASVTWIDKEGPRLSYKSEEVGNNGNVLITIESNEEINTFQPLGWTRSGNKMSLTKEFSETTTEIVTVTDNIGNQSSITVTTSIDRSTLTSDKFNVDESSLFVTRINPKTTVDDFNENVNSNGTYYIKDANGNTISGSDYITSGSKVIFNDGTNVKEYTLAVAGDLDSNGVVTVKDLATLQKMILKVIPNPSDLLKKAGDVNFDTKYNISDLAGIQRYILSNGEYEFKPKQ